MKKRGYGGHGRQKRGDSGHVNNGMSSQRRPGFVNNGEKGHGRDPSAYMQNPPSGPSVSKNRGYDRMPGSKGIGGANRVKR